MLPYWRIAIKDMVFFPRYTWGEVTSQNLWPRYDRHFVGRPITWHNVCS